MSYKPTDENCIGISYDDGSLKAAHVTASKGSVVIKQLVEETEDVKQLYNLSSKALVISAISGAHLLLRRLKLKVIKQKEIDEVFAFQAEPMLPYPIEGAVLDKWTAEQHSDQTTVAFLSAKKVTLQHHLDTMQEKGIDPETVSAYPLALTALSQFFSVSAPLKLVIGIERSFITCTLIKEGKLLASHEIPTGWIPLYETFLAEKEPHENPAEGFFANGIEAPPEWLQEIALNAIALQKETKSSSNPILLITGEGANIKGLSEQISSLLELETVLFTTPCSKEDFNRFALPIGLALTGLPAFQEKVNFRQEEYAFSSPWKRYKKPLAMIASLGVILAASIYLFTQSYVQYREDQLRDRFLSLLTMTQKPYEQFEKQYEQKSGYGTDNEPLSIQELNASALIDRLDALERQIRALPDTFPLYPNTPRVSDVLAWLSSHPSLDCSKGQDCPSVQIESLSYSMVKRPEMNKRNEKYQVKIDLEFSTSSPTVAREFHDALISPNDFIDPKGEIKWNATKGKYRTSFYLKDKTFYPTALKGGT